MEWCDNGILLSARPHGEHALILSVLTENHGRHAGLVRGGAGARARGLYQPGNELTVTWRARLTEHLGSYSSEIRCAWPALVLDEPLRLAALTSACAVAEAALPERESHPAVFLGLRALFDALTSDMWSAAYVQWEVALLSELGFGLDLSACAATGERETLAYISPRTGRAVSRLAGEPYKDRLLPLPRFLTGKYDMNDDALAEEIRLALRVTGHFLDRHVWGLANRPEPPARTRLIDRLAH